MMICLYSIDYYDGEKTRTAYGLISADSYTTAIQYLENTLYGDDLIKINALELFDTIPEFPKEIYEKLIDHFNSTI
jgi:vacuolar-type H+-ATPase subunit C/Vma6